VINFVSNLPKDLRSGGFSAMNAAAFGAISKHSDVHYVGPINPTPRRSSRLASKLLRVVGARSDFSFFSDRRLTSIARQVQESCRPSARLDFFHGFTPWIRTRSARPYVAWSDCTFRDYIDIFHQREQFRAADLSRIERDEATWLNGAATVLFTNDWAARRAIEHYGLCERRVQTVGIFGEVDVPLSDGYAGAKEFVFVSTNFEAKGGRVVLAAFRAVRTRHPDASLVIVGDRPVDALADAGVEFAGLLRKEDPQQRQQFQALLSRARAVVHPTTADIAPLLIIEAGYYGCPVISSRKFAIPEVVDDGRTGLLVDDASDPEVIARAMNRMLEDDAEYHGMREATWTHSRAHHSKRRFEERLVTSVRALA